MILHDDHDHDHYHVRTEVDAKRTREGTYPPGAQWTRNPLNSTQPAKQHGYVMDLVQVPSNLQPGVYVLSFRWDCERSRQGWNVCSNVEIF